MKSIALVVMTVGLGAMVAGAAEGEVKPRPVRPIPDWAKQFDKNGDGNLDPQETQAATKFRRDEAMKMFDKNGDGKLDQEEQKARNESLRKEREAAFAKRKADEEKKKNDEKKNDEKKEEKKDEKK